MLPKEALGHNSPSRSGAAGEDGSGTSLCCEMLQSYRLVFAQDAKSRRIFWKQARPALKKRDYYDTFLDDLCGRKATSIKNVQSDLCNMLDLNPENLSLSQFPTYREQLYAIQKYIERRRPRRLLEIWRDRREPERFFTFWAVIFFGSAGLVLSVIQVLLTAAQLWVDYKQLQQGLK